MKHAGARLIRDALGALSLLGAVTAVSAGPAIAAVRSIMIFECGRATTTDKSILSPPKALDPGGLCRRMNPEHQPLNRLENLSTKTAVNPANTAHPVQIRRLS